MSQQKKDKNAYSRHLRQHAPSRHQRKPDFSPTKKSLVAGLLMCALVASSCGGSGQTQKPQTTDSIGLDSTPTTRLPPQVPTTLEDQPTWVYKSSFDAFAAPWAQATCDTLRRWKAPAETTAKEVSDFTKLFKALKRLIGSPSDASFSDTYWELAALANAALEYEQKYPNDENSSWSVGTGMHDPICESLNLTEANSKFGSLPDGSFASDKAPSTTAKSSPTTVASPGSQSPSANPKPTSPSKIFSTDNLGRLYSECEESDGCLAQYAWFENFLASNSQVTTKTHTSSKACMAFFRDLIAILDTYPSRDEIISWNDENWGRCRKQ